MYSFDFHALSCSEAARKMSDRIRDRNPPDGYRLSVVQFKDGMPIEPSTSQTAAVNIMYNANNAACPNSCFRPAGLAWDSKDRLYMSSDSTGEIFIIGGIS
jgi:hypothetical protein